MSDEKLGINPLTAAEAEAEAGPVEIHPQTPFTAIAVVHHRHGGGPWAPACVACEIERLKAELAEDRRFCLCGCAIEDHENYGEDGESCGDGDHVCLRACAAVASEYRRALEESERLEERVSDLECVSGLKEVLEGCEHKTSIDATVALLTPPPEGATDLIWYNPETSGGTPWLLPKLLKTLRGEKP